MTTPKKGTAKKRLKLKRSAPTSKVSEEMGKAAILIAHGKSYVEAAEALGLGRGAIHHWQKRWKEAWEGILTQAAESVTISIRAMAGTEKILDDPDKYIAAAAFADKWADRQGAELFPIADDELTLCRFYKDWYLPQCLFDAREKTKESYNSVLKQWRLITGDPPVKSISSQTVALFRNAKLKMRGINGRLYASPNGVRTKLKMIQTLLDKLGSSGRDNRDALNILDQVPWAKPPREEKRIPQTITLQQLSDCVAAAVAMEVPRIPGIKPPAWWRALLAVAWNTGLRRGTLLSMRMDEIDWAGCRLMLPAARMKSRRPMIVHLNAVAMTALRSIQTDRELVFPWPHNIRHLDTCRHRLQEAAGIPKEKRFGFHAIRKTIATILWEESPGAAQFALGHTLGDVTQKRYVDGGELVARALDRLPQPGAFTNVLKSSDDDKAA